MIVALIDDIHPIFEELMENGGASVRDLTTTKTTDLLMHLQDVDGIAMRSRISIDGKILDNLPNLKFIARSGAGMEHIDQNACAQRGVTCYNSPEGNREAVAEHALGMLLALMNRLHVADRSVRDGNWERERFRGFELNGLTVGLIGFGNIGSTFARLLSGFNVTVLANDIEISGFSSGYIQESTIDRIQHEADVLSIHTPLTDSTRGMVNRGFINAFAKPFWLVNTARGGIVETSDLLDAIDQGKIRGAALDVSEFEHSSFQSLDEVPPTLHRAWENPNIIFSPHIAGWTVESKQKLAEILARKILDDV